MGADPAEHIRRARRRDRAREPVGEQHHGRQGRLPARAVRVPVRADDRRLPVHRGRAGRVDDRPRVGRSGADLRERRPARRVRTVRDRRAADPRRHRPRPARRRPCQHLELLGDSIGDHRGGCRACGGSISIWGSRASRARSCRFAGGSSASRTSRPIPPAATSAATRSTASRCAASQTRLQATGIEKVVIGVSGGLDSTHALIVAARALDRLGLPRENVLAYTMPGFATSDAHAAATRTALMRALGVSARRARHPAGRDADAPRPRPSRRRTASRSTTSRSRTCRRASAPRTCSGSPTTTARSCSAPATCPSWRSGGARTASATRCRTTTSTPRSRRR